MKLDFLIIPKDQYKKNNQEHEEVIITIGDYFFITPKIALTKLGDFNIFIDGYVIPRSDCFEEYKKYSQYELVLNLFIAYKKDFLQHIKGNFIIVIAGNGELLIATDHHSVKKFYVYRKQGFITISNNFKLISKYHALEIDGLYPSIMALFQHPVNSRTIFKDLYFSKPSEIIILNAKIKSDTYWNPLELLNRPDCCYEVTELIARFKSVIDNAITYLKPKQISLTLTGGRDTRSVLAALLNLGRIPHSFTFGFPSGKDVVASKRIIEELGLPFSNHFIENLNEETYLNLVNELVENSNPLISIHRAHRLHAIKREQKELGIIDAIFVGSMGGDYIKGVSFNDYIVSEFIRRYFFEKIDLVSLLKEILNKHYINYDDNIISQLIEQIRSVNFLDKNDFKKSELLIAHSLIGSTHDVQDIEIFSNFSNYVLAPFMDIDFMEFLFKSEYSLFSNSRTTRNPFILLKGGELQANLIDKLYPPLSVIPMANLYKPKDLLGNRLLYLIKRIYLHSVKVNNTPTFSYGQWFIDFVQDQLSLLNKDLSSFYNYTKLREDFVNDNHLTTEGYWHKYTNPIQLSLNIGKINYR